MAFTFRLREAVVRVKKDGRLVPTAIIPVDVFGLRADYGGRAEIAAEFGLFIKKKGLMRCVDIGEEEELEKWMMAGRKACHSYK